MAVLLLAGALAACGGDTSGPDADGDAPESEESDSRSDAGRDDDERDVDDRNNDADMDDEGHTYDNSPSFKSVSAGHSYTCGVMSGGAISCWGDNGSSDTATPPGGSFDSVCAGVSTPAG